MGFGSPRSLRRSCSNASVVSSDASPRRRPPRGADAIAEAEAAELDEDSGFYPCLSLAHKVHAPPAARRGAAVAAEFLWECQAYFFELLESGEPCDIILVEAPAEALDPIDGACSAIGACWDCLLTANSKGRADAHVAPVLACERAYYTDSPLEDWFLARGVDSTMLLFLDDVRDVVAAAEAAASDGIVRLEVARVELEPVFPSLCADYAGAPGALGCYSSYVAARLLARAADLVPAARPGARRGTGAAQARLFSSGPAAEDELFTQILSLVGGAIETTTANFDPELEGVRWCVADSDVMDAIRALENWQ